VHGGPEALRSDIDVDDNALRFAGQSGIAIGHGEGYHLVTISFAVTSPKTQPMRTSLGQVMIFGKLPFFSFWPLTMASMMDGWSLPRFTKTWETPYSHKASKKANDAV